jgi:hypothetical protein
MARKIISNYVLVVTFLFILAKEKIILTEISKESVRSTDNALNLHRRYTFKSTVSVVPSGRVPHQHSQIKHNYFSPFKIVLYHLTL